MNDLQTELQQFAALIAILLITVTALSFALFIKTVQKPFNDLLYTLTTHQTAGRFILDILSVLSLIVYFIILVRIFL